MIQKQSFVSIEKILKECEFEMDNLVLNPICVYES